MDGEQQLLDLEQEEALIKIQGGIFPAEKRKKLLRAKEIEENVSIYSEERNDPVLEAAYQRGIRRNGGEIENRESRIERNKTRLSEDFGFNPEETLRQNTIIRNTPRLRQQATEEKKPPNKKPRISSMVGIAMIITALFIDGFEALLNFLLIGEFFSTIISIAATTLFTIWCWMVGVTFIKKPKNLAAMGIQAIAGMIPILNTLPELSMGITAIVIMTQMEDKNGLFGNLAKFVS